METHWAYWAGLPVWVRSPQWIRRSAGGKGAVKGWIAGVVLVVGGGADGLLGNGWLWVSERIRIRVRMVADVDVSGGGDWNVIAESARVDCSLDGKSWASIKMRMAYLCSDPAAVLDLAQVFSCRW